MTVVAGSGLISVPDFYPVRVYGQSAGTVTPTSALIKAVYFRNMYSIFRFIFDFFLHGVFVLSRLLLNILAFLVATFVENCLLHREHSQSFKRAHIIVSFIAFIAFAQSLPFYCD